MTADSLPPLALSPDLVHNAATHLYKQMLGQRQLPPHDEDSPGDSSLEQCRVCARGRGDAVRVWAIKGRILIDYRCPVCGRQWKEDRENVRRRGGAAE